MAARRLLIVMLALLALSTLAAALVPPPAQRQGETSGTETTRKPERASRERGVPGRLVRGTIDASGNGPQAVRLRHGDELALTVRSGAPDQVAIPEFGLIEDVGRDDPARFDLLPDRTGRFAVRLVDAGRSIGTIAVSPAHH